MKFTLILGLVLFSACVIFADDVTPTSNGAATTEVPITKKTTTTTMAPTTAPTTTTTTSTTTTTTTTPGPGPVTTTMAPPSHQFPTDKSTFPSAVKLELNSTDAPSERCLRVTMATQFVIEVRNKTEYLNLENAVLSPKSSCKDVNVTLIPLVLQFGGNNVTFEFKRDDNRTSAWLNSIVLHYHLHENETEVHQFNSTEHLFLTTVGTAYTGKRFTCSAETRSKQADQVTAVFKDVSIEIGWSDGTNAEETKCEKDTDVNDMIPIAVGAALLALVAIVLVAYFVGRRRSRRLAYQSV